MSLWRQFIRGLRVLTNRRSADQEIADEVEVYREHTIAALVASAGFLPTPRAEPRNWNSGT